MVQKETIEKVVNGGFMSNIITKWRNCAVSVIQKRYSNLSDEETQFINTYPRRLAEIITSILTIDDTLSPLESTFFFNLCSPYIENPKTKAHFVQIFNAFVCVFLDWKEMKGNVMKKEKMEVVMSLMMSLAKASGLEIVKIVFEQMKDKMGEYEDLPILFWKLWNRLEVKKCEPIIQKLVVEYLVFLFRAKSTSKWLPIAEQYVLQNCKTPSKPSPSILQDLCDYFPVYFAMLQKQ